MSLGELALTLVRPRQYDASGLVLAQLLAPTLAVYGWFAFRRFYGASRWYAKLAAVVFFLLSQGLFALILILP
jgi:hypothetical protein